MNQDETLCVIGLGFVGLPVAATFAELGLTVTGVDAAPHVLESLKNGKAHFEEEGLQELLSKVLGKGLTISDAVEKSAHDMYVIAVGTPIDEATMQPVMTYVEGASKTIGQALKKGDLVIMRSTVPVGVTRKIVLPILEKESGLKGGEDFDLVFAPERLVSGKALTELRELPQMIGGMNDGSDVQRASALFQKLTPNIVAVENLEAGELGKLIDNTYRDLHFAYANQMAQLGEKMDVDITRLVRDVNNGYKRNRIPVPSPGVGGICLKKDPYLLMYSGKEYGYHPKLTEVARTLNQEMPVHVADRVLELLQKAGKDPASSTVLILGFAFKGKPETSDNRDSPTTTVVKALQDAGCTVIGHDPVVPETRIKDLGVEIVTIEEGFKKADAAVIMTNHSAYESLDIKTLVSSMKQPACLLDGWHIYDTEELKSISDLHYAGVGNN
jgi:nucleotide sugar dehydrogenase